MALLIYARPEYVPWVPLYKVRQHALLDQDKYASLHDITSGGKKNTLNPKRDLRPGPNGIVHTGALGSLRQPSQRGVRTVPTNRSHLIWCSIYCIFLIKFRSSSVSCLGAEHDLIYSVEPAAESSCHERKLGHL